MASSMCFTGMNYCLFQNKIMCTCTGEGSCCVINEVKDFQFVLPTEPTRMPLLSGNMIP